MTRAKKWLLIIIIICLLLSSIIYSSIAGMPWDRIKMSMQTKDYIRQKYNYNCKVVFVGSTGWLIPHFGSTEIDVMNNDETFKYTVYYDGKPYSDTYLLALMNYKIGKNLSDHIKNSDINARLIIDTYKKLEKSSDYLLGGNGLYLTEEEIDSDDFWNIVDKKYICSIIFDYKSKENDYSINYDLVFDLIKYMKAESMNPYELKISYMNAYWTGLRPSHGDNGYRHFRITNEEYHSIQNKEDIELLFSNVDNK